MTNGSKALIIAVNFKSASCTLRFLRSASRLDGFSNSDLIVVDNDSQDGSAGKIREVIGKFRNVEVMSSSKNLGYFGAASWALRHYRSLQGLSDWVIVCNNDILFEDTLFLRRLLEKDPESVGMLAPSILSGLTGHDANPSIRSRPSRFRMMRYRLWLSNYYAMWFKQSVSPFARRVFRRRCRNAAIAGESAVQKTYAPHGACMIFSRKFFEAGCYIDDGFFLYAEEFSVAEMCRKVGLVIVHDPQLRVWHQEGQSTGRMLSRRIHQYQKEGFEYALARYDDCYPALSEHATRDKVTTEARIGRDFASLSGDRIR